MATETTTTSSAAATTTASAQTLTGCVKWFNNGLNYGFITVLTDGEYRNTDVFVHQSNIRTARDCFRTLYTGECVQFELAKSDNEKHPVHAVNVHGFNGVQLRCEVPRGGGFRGGRGRGAGARGRGGPRRNGGNRQQTENATQEAGNTTAGSASDGAEAAVSGTETKTVSTPQASAEVVDSAASASAPTPASGAKGRGRGRGRKVSA